MVKWNRFAFLLVILCLAFVPAAQAELTAMGPNDAVNGFPQWFQDSNGVTLEIGLDPFYSAFDPVIPGNEFSEAIGFGPEAFWFLAGAEMEIRNPANPNKPGDAEITLAVEAAFGAENPIDGDQFAFTRLRIRIDTPVAGTYTVTHPYGVDVFENVPAGDRAINSTIDIGGFYPDYTRALNTRIGPFLVAVNPPPPAGFIGNVNGIQTVTGSPFGTNYFRVDGPPGSNLDGAGNDFIETDLFELSGKLFTGTGFNAQRVEYQRDAVGAISVWATGFSNATLTVTGDGVVETALRSNGAGRFFGLAPVPDGAAMPAEITITGTSPTSNPSSATFQVVDAVTITKAEYDEALKRLTIEAHSGDLLSPPTLTAQGFGALSNGVLVINNVLVPPPSVTVSSSAGGSDTREVAIKVPSNQQPVATDDTAEALTAQATAISVLANDTDADGTLDVTTVTVVDAPVNGTAVANVDGTVTYTSNADFEGGDTFTYTVKDNMGAVSNTATVVVTVTKPNAAPVAVDDTAEAFTAQATAISVLANDTDADGALDVTTVTVIDAPANGTAIANADGTVTYTSNADFEGSDSFTYTVKDDDGAESNTATVTVTVTKPNEAPVAVDDSVSAVSGVEKVIDVLANDSDADGTLDVTSVTVIDQPASGTVVVNADGTIAYTSELSFEGTDSFTYTVKDDEGAVSNTATVTISISHDNQPPVATDDSAEAFTAQATAISVLANDTDADGALDVTTVTVIDAPANGTAVANADGTVTYTSNADFEGTDTFTYTVKDDLGAVSNIATVTVTVTKPNAAPVAVDDSADALAGVEVIISVLANDSDADGTLDVTTVTVVDAPANGTAVANADGTISYTANVDFSGTDSFTYTVKDDEGAVSNTATVTITVTVPNEAPVAVDDTADALTAQATVISVLANDTDADGTLDVTAVTVVDAPANGTAVANADGTVTYTSNADFEGSDTFTYTVKDDDGAVSNTATVTVTVITPNVVPVAADDSAQAITGEEQVIDVLANDTDADGTLDVTTVTVVSAPANGTAVANADGTVSYTSNVGYVGADSFTYTVKDNEGAVSNTATVSVTVQNIGTAGTGLSGDYYDSLDFIAFALRRTDATVNFTWLNGSPDASMGVDTFTVRWTGKILAPYSEEFTFYTVSDDGVRLWVNDQLIIDNWTNHAAVENSGKITLVAGQRYDIRLEYFESTGDATIRLLWSSASQLKQVVPTAALYPSTLPPPEHVNREPVAVEDVTVAVGDETVTVAVLANDYDLDGALNTGSVVIVTPPLFGTAVAQPNGTVLYTPATGFSGDDSFTYTVEDNEGAVSNAAQVTVTVVEALGSGLLGEYYDNMDFTALKLRRTDATVDFNWRNGSPAASVGADTFSVRWTGQVRAPFSQEFTFYTVSDDGVRLWVNNQLIIDNWTNHASVENSGKITLVAGQRYDIRLEYFDNTGGAIIRLLWSSASQSKQVIPSNRLFSVAP